MYILGTNAYHGDAAAALIKDGQLVAAAEEERFRRIKHCAGFPTQSIQYCLPTAGIDIEQVEHVGILLTCVVAAVKGGKLTTCATSWTVLTRGRSSAMKISGGNWKTQT